MSSAASSPRHLEPAPPLRQLRVSVLYNDDGALAHGNATDNLAVASVVACAEAVANAVRHNHWEAILVAAVRDPVTLIESLRRTKPDVVFNLVESVDGDSRLEAALAWMLELSEIAYTGNQPLAMSLGLDKPTAKAVLASHGIAVPRGALLNTGEEPLPPAPPPWIVKPAHEDASHGIDRDSIVYDSAAARARALHVIATYAQPALIEEFLSGREFNLGVVGEGDGATMLSPAEIDFDGLPGGHPRLVTYEAKWDEASAAYQGTPAVAARALSHELEQALRQTALGAYRALGLRDYGRVDLRLDATGAPVVLEVNPNPDLSPTAGFARAAERSGIPYDQLIARIVAAAIQRRHRGH